MGGAMLHAVGESDTLCTCASDMLSRIAHALSLQGKEAHARCAPAKLHSVNAAQIAAVRHKMPTPKPLTMKRYPFRKTDIYWLKFYKSYATPPRCA